MSKRDVKNKVLSYYLSQHKDSHKSLHPFFTTLYISHMTNKRILSIWIVIACSLYAFASPTEAAWKQNLRDFTNKTVHIVKTVFWDVSIQEQEQGYFAEFWTGDNGVTLGVVSIWSGNTKDALLSWFVDEVKSTAKTQAEISDYIKSHKKDTDQNKVNKHIQTILEQHNTHSENQASWIYEAKAVTWITTDNDTPLKQIPWLKSFPNN